MIGGSEKAEMKEKRLKFLNQVFDHDGNVFICLIIGIAIGLFITLLFTQTTIDINNYIPVLGTLGAAFAGAWVAFRLNQSRELKKEKLEHISAGNKAIFALYQMWRALSMYKLQVIDPLKDRPDAWLNMDAVNTEQYTDISIDIGSVSFLLDFKYADICNNLYLAQNSYRSYLILIKKRTDLILKTVLPVMEKMNLGGIDSSDSNLVEQNLGSEISFKLKSYYKNIVSRIKDDIPFIVKTYNELRNAMKSLYPDEEILEFSLE